MVFVIHLLSAEQQPPVFQMAAPSLEVSQGGKATLGEWGARAGPQSSARGAAFSAGMGAWAEQSGVWVSLTAVR